jgi:predicted enzyme related to lactoylglutathione lyase
MAHPVVHFEVGTRDTDRSIAFYRDLFGWNVRDAGPGYWLVDGEDGGIGGGLMQTRDDIPPYVTVYVAVDDLSASLDHAVGLGGKLLVAATPIPGVGMFGLFEDLDGNVIGMIQQQS